MKLVLETPKKVDRRNNTNDNDGSNNGIVITIMGVPRTDMFTDKRTEQVYLKFVSANLNMISCKLSCLTAHRNKSFPAGEIIHIQRGGNNIYFSV